MVIRNSEMSVNVNTNMRGGEGNVKITKIVEKPHYDGNSRLIATIHLEPGASIGASMCMRARKKSSMSSAARLFTTTTALML